ncbi:hypothetical protein [Pseudobacillus wudalianchiensis]|uniref:Flagellar hook-length control protein-like C-terminal domain-containing protein n=1 Tax=Pseudobacillus wudalianchiensis TaxID=1743143 RepID=A0A1B9AYV6_9BACI|nr:hypothetical protein [Bacillus wudalianchiensis]OCA89014.1 hypothetical protein A8F95_06260 [Bacillus wudalianchiensis]
MQVNLDPKLSAVSSEGTSLILKEGDVYQAKVKEKLPGNEAILQIRGKDVTVKVEGDLPESGKVAIEVLQTKDGMPVVKAAEAAGRPAEKMTADQLLVRLNSGQPLSSDVKAAVSVLMEKGIPLNRETLQEIKLFVGKAEGSLPQKLETIKAAANKQLEITAKQLSYVHDALHKSSVGESVSQLLKETGLELETQAKPAYTSQKLVETAIQKLTDVLQAVAKQRPNDPVIQQLIEALKQGESVKKVGEAIKLQFAKELLTSPQISKSIDDAIKLEMLANRMSPATAVAAEKTEITAAQKLTAILQTLGKQNPGSMAIGQLIEELQQGADLTEISEAVKDKFSKELSASPQLLKEIDHLIGQEKAKANVQPDVKAINAKTEINEAIRMVKKEPDMQKLLRQVRDGLLADNKLPAGLGKSIELGVEKAEQEMAGGKELAARGELMHILQEADAKLQPASLIPADEVYTIPNEIIASLPAHSKDLIVTKITEKLSQMTIDFKQIKRDISRNLQMMDGLINQFKQRSLPQVKPLLESTIKMLDKTILKGDFLLYTDMATEKKLLRASSQLSEAKQLLMKGQTSEASKIVSEVKKLIENVIFKPADVRVKHFVSKELLQFEPPSLKKETAEGISQSLRMMHDEPTGRRAFEHMRTMGLTYEHEQANALLSKGKPQEELNASLKNMLMRMAQTDEGSAGGKTDQLLSQITGQQLLSKTDTGGLQSMMMSLPFLLQDKVENFKVFIQSKSGQQTVDWENCSLYFLFETKKLGEIGVSLTAVDRLLSIKVKNDKPGFKERMSPLAEAAKERLGDIGYQVGAIQFEELTKEAAPSARSKKEKSENTLLPVMTEKGYDYTI